MINSTRQRSLVGVIAAMAVVNLVYGITFPLLALVLDSQNVSKSLIGLSTIVQAGAVLAIAPFAPGLMARFAPAKLMQAMSVALALLFIIAGLYPNVWFWFPLRLVIGAATALLWIASEALINELAVERWRGRIIAIYASVGAAGFALGPLLLIITGPEGMAPFVATSVMILLAGLPLFYVTHNRLEFSGGSNQGIWRIFLLAPVIMLANVVYAASAESIITFFPLYGMHFGMTTEFALGLMTIMGAGGMILALPLGWVADHVNRMGMLVFILIFTMTCLLAMPHVLQLQTWLVFLFVFVFGGVEGMIYALGVVLIGERFRGAQLASATTAFSACWGAGTMLGPLLVGVGMDRFGNGSMLLIIFAFFAVYLPLPVVAWLRSMRRQADQTTGRGQP
jgi:MFS family permease